jgi:hypothetical protein
VLQGQPTTHEEREVTTYRIVRFYKSDEIPTEVLWEGATLEFAQEWCQNPETNSDTATGPQAIERTERCGKWFDGYQKEAERA